MRSKCLTNKDSPCQFIYDGKVFEAMQGDTIAAALIAACERVGRFTQKGNPRHLFCGIGVCFECMVIVKDLGAVRACMTKVTPGMQVSTWPKDGLPNCSVLPSLGKPPSGEIPRHKCQVAVIGAGPGGLAAATAAAQCGVEVVIIDERPASGGQLYKQLIPSMESVSGRPLDKQYSDGRKLIEEEKDAGCQFISDALVWRASIDQAKKIEICTYHNKEVKYYYPDQLVIATGAYDEPLPVPGWTLPGVMTAGAAQTLVRTYGVLPPAPLVIAGNGPLVLQVAYELVRAGVHIAAVVSTAKMSFNKYLYLTGMLFNNPQITLLGAKYLKEIKRHKIPLINGHAITRIDGNDRCENVTIAPVDSQGKPDESRQRQLKVESVCLSYGLLPANEVARQLGCRFIPDSDDNRDLISVRENNGQSSLDSIYIVGEAGGVVGGYMAIYQGYLAGWSVAEKIGKIVPEQRRVKVRREFNRHKKFQKYLWHALSGPNLGLKTCER